LKSVKKIAYLFLLFILLNAGLAEAETEETYEMSGTHETAEITETPENAAPFRIGTGFGYSFAGYREETDLPLNRYINFFSFVLDGNFEKGNYIYSFNSLFLIGKNMSISINTTDDYFTYYQKESNCIRASIENALDYHLWGADSSSSFPGYLGGALRCDVYFIHLPQTFYYSLTAIVSLNVHVSQKWIINEKNTLVFSASLPVFGYGVRPPYYGLLYTPLDLAMDFVSLHNYWAVFCDVKYQYKINNLLCFYTNLGFELSHITFPQPRKDASIRVNAGISFNF